jgi:hypothetical protein
VTESCHRRRSPAASENAAHHLWKGRGWYAVRSRSRSTSPTVCRVYHCRPARGRRARVARPGMGRTAPQRAAVAATACGRQFGPGEESRWYRSAVPIGGLTVCQEMVDPCEHPSASKYDEVTAVLVARMEPTMWVRAGIGVVLCAVGTVWILQGTKVIQGMGMSGQGKWAVIGAVVVVVGLACFAWAARQRRKGTTESS